MGVKLVIFKDEDPGIGITLTEVSPGVPGKARGWHGTCTACGKPMHFWTEAKAFRQGQKHVDEHDTELIGGDTDAFIRD